MDTLLPRESQWRFQADGTDLGTAWSDTTLNDDSWDSGPGILGFGESFISTVVPYGPDASNKYRTTYFRKTFAVSGDPSRFTRLLVGANYDDGAVIYLNGQEVTRVFMPAGAVSYSTFAYSHEGGAYEAIDISDAIPLLQPGDNLLAVEVHQTSASSSDLVWDAELFADSSRVIFLWSGAVTESAAVVKGKVAGDSSVVRLMVSDDSMFVGTLYSQPDTAITEINNRVVSLSIVGLAGATPYYYVLEVDGIPQMDWIGQFTTHPTAGLPASFSIACGSCASTGTTHEVFDSIATLDPLLFLHMGDMHYENIGVNDPDVFRAAYETVLTSPSQSNLYRHVPIAYMWDDHDYGPNNSDSTAPGRTASRMTYQEYVPHYPLVAGSGDVAIYQTFVIGRVKFILADSRSARSPYGSPDVPGKTMLGADQKTWFKQQLIDAQGQYPLIVWINTMPWIGLTGDDGWYRYTYERAELSDFISDNDIAGVCMLSGDAHMLAIDNGDNSDYSQTGTAPFPVMHAASLDRGGSVKGGPYSEGAYPGGGQFGLMTVTDTGGPTIHVQWSGQNAGREEIVGYSFVARTDGTGLCACPCFGDPVCDGVIDILDVVDAVDIAFRGHITPYKDALCPHERCNVNCLAPVDVFDVVMLIDVAFRNADPEATFCDPCQP